LGFGGFGAVYEKGIVDAPGLERRAGKFGGFGVREDGDQHEVGMASCQFSFFCNEFGELFAARNAGRGPEVENGNGSVGDREKVPGICWKREGDLLGEHWMSGRGKMRAAGREASGNGNKGDEVAHGAEYSERVGDLRKCRGLAIPPARSEAFD
jgi:hypothetical protein